MALGSGDNLAKMLMQMRAACRKCGKSITFEKGAQFAMDNGISDKVVMCSKCRSVFEVDINPRGFTLRVDVTDRYTTGSQDPAAQLASAIQKKDVARVKQLISGGAPLHGRIGSYDTAMVWAWELACSEGDEELAQLLLSNGGSINQSNVNGTTPIEIAALEGRLQMVQFLLERGASLTRNTLANGASSDNLELVQYLVAKGARVNSQGPGGWTPLATAALHGRLAIARYLIDCGAEVTSQAIGEAQRNGHKEVLTLLKASAKEDSSAELRASADASRSAQNETINHQRGRQNWFMRLLRTALFGRR